MGPDAPLCVCDVDGCTCGDFVASPGSLQQRNVEALERIAAALETVAGDGFYIDVRILGTVELEK